MVKNQSRLHREANLIRSLVFGLEDSLVSTVGLLSGVVAAGVNRSEIIITGVILISVEAFSMGVGCLLSENSAEEFEAKREVSLFASLPAAGVMTISYLLGGLVPLAPYWWPEPFQSLPWSVGLAVASLALLGIFNSWLFRVSPVKQILRMVVLGGLAIAIGILVGKLF